MFVFNNFLHNLWKLIPVLFICIFISPIIFVLASLFGDFNNNWNHLIDYVLPSYVSNSLILILGVSIKELIAQEKLKKKREALTISL